MKISGNSFCPCGSEKKFKKCCRVFHFDEEKPENALILMKSRYSAFAACDSSYIMKTTHKENLDYTTDSLSWENSIHEFSDHSDFRKLDILEFIDGENEAYVTFKATIFQGAIDSSFCEKSKFLKVDGYWLYHSGEIIE